MSLQKRNLQVYLRFPFLIVVNFHGIYRFKNQIFFSYMSHEKNCIFIHVDNLFLRLNCFFSNKLYLWGFFSFSDYLKFKEKLNSLNIIDCNFIPLYCIVNDKTYPLSFLDNRVQSIYTKPIFKNVLRFASFFNWIISFPSVIFRLF